MSKGKLRQIVLYTVLGGFAGSQSAWGLPTFRGLLFETTRFALQRHAPPRIPTYAVPTYDDAFKAIMMNTKARHSFFGSLIPDPIQTSTPLGLSNADALVTEDQVDVDAIGKFLGQYRSLVEEYLERRKQQHKAHRPSSGLSPTKFFDELARKFYEPLCRLFPTQDKKAILDFACRLEDGENIFVELQVRPQEHWDQRVLAYAASCYGAQPLEGEKGALLKKIYAINILGGYELPSGNETRHTWEGALKKGGATPSVMKWYRLVNRYESQEEIPELRVIQLYPQLYEGEATDMSQFDLNEAQVAVLRQWLSLFKDAHHKTERQVEAEAVDEGVREAYAVLKKHAPTPKYKEWRELYGRRYAEDLVQEVAAAEEKAKREAKREIALKMIQIDKLSDDEIAQYSGLSKEEIAALRTSPLRDPPPDSDS